MGDPKLFMPILSMTIGGAGLALPLVCCLPEMTNSLEQQTELFKQFDKDQLETFLSKFFVIMAAVG